MLEQNTALYPLKFAPIMKQKIWGGDKLRSYYRHDVPGVENVGESWELSCFEGDDSEVVNGFLAGNTLSELVEVYMGDLVGDGVYERFGREFPLLVKLIDAQKQLSIQVHPSDDVSGVQGKNELWYILQADPGAFVISGFECEVSEEECRALLEHGELDKALHYIPVSKGDAVFIPAGCVHSIGAGCLILEIQQMSDTTYRLYDFNRVDLDGNRRELHVDQAMSAMDWENWRNDKLSFPVKMNDVSTLIDRPFFTINVMEIDRAQEYELGIIDSFVVLTCVEGHVTLRYDGDYITLTDMESVLIPAEMSSLTIVPTVKSRLIEAYIK